MLGRKRFAALFLKTSESENLLLIYLQLQVLWMPVLGGSIREREREHERDNIDKKNI